MEWIEIRCYIVILDDAPNYYPNSFSGPETQTVKLESVFNVSGDVARYNTADDDNFTQVGNFWRKVCMSQLHVGILRCNVHSKLQTHS